MKKIYYYIASLGALGAGLLLYAFYNELILVKIPSKKVAASVSDINVKKRNFHLIYWHANKWVTEDKELISSDTLSKTLTNVLTSWLNLLEEEHIIQKKAVVQSVMLDATQTEAYISFDRSFLPKEFSTYRKLLLIEGLLKTLRDNSLPITVCYFLVNHQPMHDQHLDFSQGWPSTGFLEKTNF
ncbi:hypothetical protein H0X48_04905 [Candidatus Dependentiae bacterium]|nr:hypothetical protein [Candidatus Dependentiae bacterium]